MGYDKTTDTYTCHARTALKPLSIKKQKIINGYESEVTVYERKDSQNPAQIFGYCGYAPHFYPHIWADH